MDSSTTSQCLYSPGDGTFLVVMVTEETRVAGKLKRRKVATSLTGCEVLMMERNIEAYEWL